MPGAQKTQEERIVCRTPTPGKNSTRIPKAKFDLVRGAILKVAPRGGEGVEFAQLTNLIRKSLTKAQLASLGSLAWHVTTVRLELEVRGELERVSDRRPQRLRRSAPAR